MRKLILTIALASSVIFANAQVLTSKNGTPILPEADDWSIGFDAVPVLNYFGNLFNNTVNNSVTMGYPSNNGMTIVGKMVKDETTAYRAKFAINSGSRTVTRGGTFTAPDSIGTASETKYSGMNIVLGAGLQKWRGKGRLKGYYGAEAMLGFGDGNISDTNNTTKTYTYLKALTITDAAGSRQNSEINHGGTFGFGVNGFIGVEYFFAPKMSLSAEYTWGIAISSTSETETSYTIVEAPAGTNIVSSKTDKGDSSSDFNIGVGNTVTPNITNSGVGSGSIVLSFYF